MDSLEKMSCQGNQNQKRWGGGGRDCLKEFVAGRSRNLNILEIVLKKLHLISRRVI